MRLKSTLQKREYCKFCRQPGATKEHVFPEWIQKAMPVRNDVHSRLHATRDAPLGQAPLATQNAEKKQGDLYSRKVRKFCKTCNNGWMSDLQEEAKPILMDLIFGKPLTLQTSHQQTLANWIAMTTMVAEFTCPPDSIAISGQDRRDFYATRTIPSHWKVWIGRYGGDPNRKHYQHHMAKFYETNASPRPFMGPPTYKLHLTMAVIGQCFFFVFSTTMKTFPHSLSDHDADVLQLLSPIGSGRVAWPLDGKVVLDETMLSLRRNFEPYKAGSLFYL